MDEYKLLLTLNLEPGQKYKTILHDDERLEVFVADQPAEQSEPQED